MQNIKVGDRVRVKATGYETEIIAIDNNFKSHPYCIRENKEIVWYEADQLEPITPSAKQN